MWRKICRDALHDKTPGAWPKPANGGEIHYSSYCQDTIFSLPELADYDEDREMVRNVGRQVTDIITDESLSSGKERKREIRKRLKALEKEVRKTYV